jgi:leucyl aminopeptidase
MPAPEQAAALVEGTILGAYSPGRWKSKNDTRPFERIVIDHDETPELRAAVERAALLADRANRARDVANMPPNELTPATLAEEAEKLDASTSTSPPRRSA